MVRQIALVLGISRPNACQQRTASLSKVGCLEGLAKFKSKGQIMLWGELLSSKKIRKGFARISRKSIPAKEKFLTE